MRTLFTVLICLIAQQSFAQHKESGVNFLVDRSVINANDPDEKEIIDLWRGYIQSGQYKIRDSVYWNYDKMIIPDYFMWPLNTRTLLTRLPKLQVKVLGVFPVENGHYNLKSSFSHVDARGEVHLDGIVSVFAKKFDGKYLLVNSSQYHAGVWQKERIGNITYYIHPEHTFDRLEAERMSLFNQEMAIRFDVEPLKFEYYVANYARQIVQLWGHDYMPKMYIPVQSGGVADIENKIVYAGNNSEYYPHEVVHLYTHAKTTTRTHFF
ncbi:MAG: hypothetical protein AAF789_11030, partial [Bacteroidota bacterium]